MAVYFMTCTRIVNYPELYRISMSGFLNHSLRSIPIILLSAIPCGFLRLSRIVIIAFNLFLLGFQLLLISVLTYGFFRLSWYFANLIVYFKNLYHYTSNILYGFFYFSYIIILAFWRFIIWLQTYLSRIISLHLEILDTLTISSLWNYYHCEIITTVKLLLLLFWRTNKLTMFVTCIHLQAWKFISWFFLWTFFRPSYHYMVFYWSSMITH